jgi:teichuronic acid biosynthesis glycosyltransferase TuaC
MARLRVAVVSTFFPNASTPYRTLFVRHLVTALAERSDVTVIAPVPYAPPWPPRARWRALRSIPYRAQSGSSPVQHPRYIVVPKVEAFSGLTYALAVAPTLRRLARAGGIDVIHVHCAYPDAVGVALVARALGIPFVITAHGSDINVYATRKSLRAQILWALSQAAAIVAVSEDLRRKICALAPSLAARVKCIPCSGVDPSVFQLGERSEARAEQGVEPAARVALFVGNLVPIKGLDTLLEAWRILLGNGSIGAQDRLVLIGDGPLRGHFQEAAASPALAGTLQVLGPLPQAKIASWMRAGSVLCLSSLHEGMPNVVVEALASGLPVVATAVGGIPDLVRPAVNGYLAPSGNAGLLAEALGQALARKWDARQIAVTVVGYNWSDLAAKNLEVLANAVPAQTTR